MNMEQLRLIIDPPFSGTLNMAIDEVLLESAATNGVATLRLYQWGEPTLSLGYFQATAERKSHQPSLVCPFVRRASGGGAILHDRELTYSLALPEKSSSAAAARRLYELCHATLIEVLSNLSLSSRLHGSGSVCESAHDQKDVSSQPFLCFQRRTCFDIVSSGSKIVGSAQRRRRGAILQHGSILLSRSEFAPELPGIEQITGKAITTARLIELWPPQLADRLECSISACSLATTERLASETVCHKRFTTDDWLNRR
jgi:lipoate-protein ligase A